MSDNSDKKWYKSLWFTIIWLILFPPAGIILLWVFQKRLTPLMRGLITAASAVWFIVALIIGPQGNTTDTMNSNIVSSSKITSSEVSSEASSSEVVSSEPSSEPVSSEPVASSQQPIAPSQQISSAPAPQQQTPQPQLEETQIELVSVTSPIGRNETATLTIKGKPNTTYSISVFYSDSASTADGLENKTSDANGNVTWKWKVGGRTNPGTHKITISGGGQTLDTQFVTTE